MESRPAARLWGQCRFNCVGASTLEPTATSHRLVKPWQTDAAERVSQMLGHKEHLEIGSFLTFSLRDFKAGIEMAKMALALNPKCSAELWNTLGDGLFEFGRTEEARSAYQKALHVNESDVRARYNLAWCHLREKNFAAALQIIAEAMALDKTGEYRERLMQKMSEVMGKIGLRFQQEYLLLINLVSKYAKKDETDKNKPPEHSELVGE